MAYDGVVAPIHFKGYSYEPPSITMQLTVSGANRVQVQQYLTIRVLCCSAVLCANCGFTRNLKFVVQGDRCQHRKLLCLRIPVHGLQPLV